MAYQQDPKYWYSGTPPCLGPTVAWTGDSRFPAPALQRPYLAAHKEAQPICHMQGRSPRLGLGSPAKLPST